MTASAATKSDKVSVFGVNLEVLRIPAPATTSSTTLLTSLSTNHASPLSSPIVFLHEGLGSVAMWRDFPQQLCQATGRAGLVHSRRGYGQSDGIPDVRGAGRLKRDYMQREALEVLPELLRIEGIAKPILLGHSDGGTIALLHAARFDVEACIVMAPHLFVEDISISAITQAREAYEIGDLRQRLARYHADVDCAFWQWNDIWLSPEFRNFNIEAECQQITCPILAIQGHDDPYGTMTQIETLEIKTGTSPSNSLRRALLKLKQCGHSPHRDQTQPVVAAIHSFFSKIVI